MTARRTISIVALLLSLVGCGRSHGLPPLAIPAYPNQIRPHDQVTYYAEYGRTVTHTSFSTTDSPEAVLGWYRAALAAGGWKSLSEQKENISVTIAYDDGRDCPDTDLSVTAWPTPNEGTRVNVDSRSNHECNP
jgi:hypothetical protein